MVGPQYFLHLPCDDRHQMALVKSLVSWDSAPNMIHDGSWWQGMDGTSQLVVPSTFGLTEIDIVMPCREQHSLVKGLGVQTELYLWHDMHDMLVYSGLFCLSKMSVIASPEPNFRVRPQSLMQIWWQILMDVLRPVDLSISWCCEQRNLILSLFLHFDSALQYRVDFSRRIDNMFQESESEYYCSDIGTNYHVVALLLVSQIPCWTLLTEMMCQRLQAYYIVSRIYLLVTGGLHSSLLIITWARDDEPLCQFGSPAITALTADKVLRTWALRFFKLSRHQKTHPNCGHMTMKNRRQGTTSWNAA